ncbi:MAG: hypothetical protein PVG93_03980 [Phycisphaerales bacterium]|jgi:hypothetical protein
MKKILFTTLAVLFLICSFENSFAQGKGKGKGNAQVEKGQKQTKQEVKGKAEKETKDVAVAARKKTELQEPQKALTKAHQRQLMAIEEQIAHEKEKHLQRQAKLECIDKLARKKGKDELAEKALKLKQKEQQRYELMMKRMETRKQKVIQLGKTNLTSHGKESRLKVWEQSAAKERAEAEKNFEEKFQEREKIRKKIKDKAKEQEQKQKQEQAESDED